MIDSGESVPTTAAAAAEARDIQTPASDAERARPADWPVVEVDVRDDLRTGQEPFGRIMLAVGSLGEHEVLHVRAIFEPVPLERVLSKRGFAYEARAWAPDDWSAWFWRAAGIPSAHAPTRADTEEKRNDPAAVRATGEPAQEGPSSPAPVLLDVRGLQPPEPLLRTLSALESLPVDRELVHINERVPHLLLPMLAERGFAWEIDDTEAGRVIVRIYRVQSA